MRIDTVSNLVFDDEHPKCFYIISSAQGRAFAFVQCLDLGAAHCRHKEPCIKRYWGVFDLDKPEDSMESILRRVGKWPQLPK